MQPPQLHSWRLVQISGSVRWPCPSRTRTIASWQSEGLAMSLTSPGGWLLQRGLYVTLVVLTDAVPFATPLMSSSKGLSKSCTRKTPPAPLGYAPPIYPHSAVAHVSSIKPAPRAISSLENTTPDVACLAKRVMLQLPQLHSWRVVHI